MNAIHNERLKLFATYLNGLAIAIFALGALAPGFAWLYVAEAQPQSDAFLWIGWICIVLSIALHYVASLVLKGMRS